MHLYVCQYSGYVTVPPGLRQMRGGFVCAPCLANWGGGGLSRFSLLPGGWVFCVQAHESPPQLTEPQRANAKTCLQDRPNLRHKLAEVLYVLTLFQ